MFLNEDFDDDINLLESRLTDILIPNFLKSFSDTTTLNDYIVFKVTQQSFINIEMWIFIHSNGSVYYNYDDKNQYGIFIGSLNDDISILIVLNFYINLYSPSREIFLLDMVEAILNYLDNRTSYRAKKALAQSNKYIPIYRRRLIVEKIVT